MEKSFIFFNSRDELLRIDVSKIIYFEADGNYTKIILANKLCGVICMNLAQTEKALASQLKEKAQIFARIGKRYIINMRHIYQINTIKQKLILSDYTSFVFQLDISKEALKRLKEIVVTPVIRIVKQKQKQEQEQEQEQQQQQQNKIIKQ